MSATAPPSLSVDLAGWPGAVLHVGADGTIVASNGRLDARLGVPVVGSAIPKLLDPDASLRKWERLVTQRAVVVGTWELIFCRDGKTLEPGAYSVIPCGDEGACWLVEHPSPPRLDALAQEVAEVNADLSTTQRSLVIERARLARALEELERSNFALNEFAHVVSHDLKAPLRAIGDYASLVASDEQYVANPERAGYLGRILELTSRMRLMIDAALEYARVGRMGARAERVDSGRLVREVVAFLAPPPGLEIEVAPDMPVIEVERVPFEQVLRNLISNAITYRRPQGARIRVSAREAGDDWEFIVADNGPGIPEAQQSRIFRLFQTSRPGEGTGLGLALVKRIVESQQGSIAVHSARGEGAAFHVCWPRRPAGRPARATEGAA